MNVNTFLSPRMIAGATIVGLVGAAGIFIYEQVYAEKRRAMLVTEVQRLDKQMSSMRLELAALRELQKETHLKRQKVRRARREAKQRHSAARPEGGEGGGAVAGGGRDQGDGAHEGEGGDLSYASDSEYFTDYQSVLGTDGEMDSEEFYDVHTDDEDDTLRETNGQLSGAALDEDLSEKCEKSPKSSPKHET